MSFWVRLGTYKFGFGWCMHLHILHVARLLVGRDLCRLHAPAGLVLSIQLFILRVHICFHLIGSKCCICTASGRVALKLPINACSCLGGLKPWSHHITHFIEYLDLVVSVYVDTASPVVRRMCCCTICRHSLHQWPSLNARRRIHSYFPVRRVGFFLTVPSFHGS